jgi:hypothetical protein
MFGIEWLRKGVPVDKETSASTGEAEAVDSARGRAIEVARRHPGREPDCYRLTDATGEVLGVFPINRRGEDVH